MKLNDPGKRGDVEVSWKSDKGSESRGGVVSSVTCYQTTTSDPQNSSAVLVCHVYTIESTSCVYLTGLDCRSCVYLDCIYGSSTSDAIHIMQDNETTRCTFNLSHT